MIILHFQKMYCRHVEWRGGTYWDMPSANRTSFVYQFLCSLFLRSEAGDWCTIASESWFQSHTS